METKYPKDKKKKIKKEKSNDKNKKMTKSNKSEIVHKSKNIPGYNYPKKENKETLKILQLLDLKPEEEKLNNENNKKTEKEIEKEDYSDIDLYANEVLNYLEEEKQKNIPEVEETKEEKDLPKKKTKKVSTIEVEENLEVERDIDNVKDTLNGDTLIEVKDKIFTIALHEIKEKILYDKRILIKERHQPKGYPNIINYRCKNQRKNEHVLGANFCNALIKRKHDK